MNQLAANSVPKRANLDQYIECKGKSTKYQINLQRLYILTSV